MKITRSGNMWKKAPKYLKGYSRNLPILNKKMLMVAGELYLKELQDRIKKQPSEVPSLKAYTKRIKREKGYDSRIWIKTGFFKDHLKIIQLRKGVIGVGATEMKHKPSGMSMAELAEKIEYGDPQNNQPPRPLFNPAYEEFKKHIKVKIDVLLKTMNKTGFGNVKFN